MALLAFSISKEAKELGLPPEDQEQFCGAADTILNLCAAEAVCTAHVQTWMTVVLRQTWLRLSSFIPEEMRKELLQGPISPDGLFCHRFQLVLEHTQPSSDTQEQVQKRVA